jgi:hypothetical protein
MHEFLMLFLHAVNIPLLAFPYLAIFRYTKLLSFHDMRDGDDPIKGAGG